MKFAHVVGLLLISAMVVGCTTQSISPAPSTQLTAAESEAPAPTATLPAPGLPSATPAGIPDPTAAFTQTEVIDPYIDIGAAQTVLQVGDVITVTGKPMQIGLPYYYLFLRDEGVQDMAPVAQITYQGEFSAGEGKSQVLELVSAQADMQQVLFVLRALAPGVTTLSIQATGEIRLQDGAYSMSGTGSGEILISVSE
jgi:hypothetical protein